MVLSRDWLVKAPARSTACPFAKMSTLPDKSKNVVVMSVLASKPFTVASGSVKSAVRLRWDH